MTADWHERVADIFEMAMDVLGLERAALLDRECAGDPLLRQEVERLLREDATLPTTGESTHPIDGPPIVSPAALAAALTGPPADDGSTSYLADDLIDGYRIVREIGRGGFGVVYLAARMTGTGLPVAIKVLEGVSLSQPLAIRFKRESGALAILNHPGIARLYSEGVTPKGHPYFAMEFVAAAVGKDKAPHITTYADTQKLTVQARVKLFIPVCHAVHHAHQQQYIHRDLKPSNILVEERDGSAHPKVIDFGIARRLEAQTTGDHDPRPVTTRSSKVLGTPGYMSPEQADGAYVGAPSDVYSLGVVLYELLCGTLPLPSFQRPTTRAEQQAAMRTEQAVRPSEIVLQTTEPLAAARSTDPQRLAKQLRGDLDTILQRSLERDLVLRFPSANDLAEDLRRFLEHEPIESRPHSLPYVLGKLALRHRAFVIAAAIALASLLVAVVVSLWALSVATSERQQTKLIAATGNLTAAQYEFPTDDGAAIGRRLDAVPPEHRGWEWRHLHLLSDRSVRCIPNIEGMASALAIHGDSQRLLVGDRNGNTTTWNAASLQRVEPTLVNPPVAFGGRDVWSIAWNRPGSAIATGSFDNRVRLFHADGSPGWTADAQQGVRYETVYAVAFSIDGRWLAVGGGTTGKQQSFIALHDAATGAGLLVNTDHTGAVSDLAFSPDGRWLASAADDHSVRLWRVVGDHLEPAGKVVEDGMVNAVAFSPDSTLLAAGIVTQTVELYRVPSLEPVGTLQGHRSALASLAFHPHGRQLASASWDSTIRIWSIPDGRELEVLRGHRGRVNRVAFAPDGRLFSASDDKTVREWRTNRSELRSLKVGDQPIRALSVLANGDIALLAGTRLCVMVRTDGSVKFEVGTLQSDHLATSPDGSTIAWRADGCIHTWRADRGKTSHPHAAVALEPTPGIVAPDDRHLLVVHRGGVLQLDHAANRWSLLRPLPAGCDGSYMQHDWLGNDGQVLATFWSNHGGPSHVTRNGRSKQLPPPWNLTWWATGRYAVLTDQEVRTLRVFDGADGSLTATLEGHREKVVTLAFSPDGTRLATVAQDQTLRIWDWRRSLQVLSIPFPTTNGSQTSASFLSVAWSPDGHTLVTGSTDGVVHFWPSRPQ